MTTNTKHPCEAQITVNWASYPCGKTASIEEGGKWYCRTHAPSLVEAKRDASAAEWKRNYDLTQAAAVAKTRRRNAEAKACEGVPTELLEITSVASLLDLADAVANKLGM